jgi:hypothetical protein
MSMVQGHPFSIAFRQGKSGERWTALQSLSAEIEFPA